MKIIWPPYYLYSGRQSINYSMATLNTSLPPSQRYAAAYQRRQRFSIPLPASEETIGFGRTVPFEDQCSILLMCTKGPPYRFAPTRNKKIEDHPLIKFITNQITSIRLENNSLYLSDADLICLKMLLSGHEHVPEDANE